MQWVADHSQILSKLHQSSQNCEVVDRVFCFYEVFFMSWYESVCFGFKTVTITAIATKLYRDQSFLVTEPSLNILYHQLVQNRLYGHPCITQNWAISFDVRDRDRTWNHLQQRRSLAKHEVVNALTKRVKRCLVFDKKTPGWKTGNLIKCSTSCAYDTEAA